MIVFRATPADSAIVGVKLKYFFPVIIPTSFVLFGLLFPNRKINIWIPKLLFICTLIAGIMTLLKDVVIIDVLPNIGGEKAIVHGWGYYYVYIFYYPTFFIIGYIIILLNCMKKHGVERMQLLLVFLGMVFGSGISLITDIVLPAFKIFDYMWIGPVSTIFWFIGAYLAISKYKILNLEGYYKFRF